MSLQKLYVQFEDSIRKIDMKLKYEDFKNMDATSKNISDMKIILSASKKTVNKNSN
jgi:hypothetical protein